MTGLLARAALAVYPVRRGRGVHPSSPAYLDVSHPVPSNMRVSRPIALALIAVSAQAALACDADAFAIFRCEAANGRKFIELCSSSPPARDGFLAYRFGALDPDGREQRTELSFPQQRRGSLARFYAATYEHDGAYVQSIRFTTATHSYTVFTRARKPRDEDAGVEVRDLATGKKATVHCSERPRFYIFDLKGLLACDAETPIGKACIR